MDYLEVIKNYFSQRKIEREKEEKILELVILANNDIDEDSESARDYFKRAHTLYDTMTSSSERIGDELCILTLLLTSKKRELDRSN